MQIELVKLLDMQNSCMRRLWNERLAAISGVYCSGSDNGVRRCERLLVAHGVSFDIAREKNKK